MSRMYESEETDAVLLVDADNAFNRLNRKTALANVAGLCPPLYKFLKNSYNKPSKLHCEDGTYILSQEGTTQGDPLAMAMYAVATRRLLDKLKDKVPGVKQVWYADDCTGAGQLRELHLWWKEIVEIGPTFGYYPKPDKSRVTVKTEEMVDQARQIFGDSVKVTCEGERHVWAALGTERFKREYVNGKVSKWVEDVKQLADIASDEPQAALSAYNTGMVHRWTFLQRTVGGYQLCSSHLRM